MNIRVGHGYDVHRLVTDRKLILGGVEIPFEMGLLGHSDADVLLHAVSDALLGAAALGDIGKHFPDNDDSFKNIDSRILLRRVVELLEDEGYGISNIDATVIMQRPKLKPFIPEMVNNIAADCKILVGQVNVKATTEEKLGFTGEGLGVSAHAVCLIYKK
ncbi:MAG: 2-C-methyl-D-erythritol 2,4-cyclodiphosphate synthase [Clostridia bacterium]|nr:2-C-methyl-D-erythritol 2,4-cyclodiphosphate synthase [Clostridia bacterium]